MNIIFLLRGTEIGGIEIVTKCLAQKFISEGHWVGLFIFRKDEGESIVEHINPQIKVFQQNDYRASCENINRLRNVLIEYHVDIIINQWGLPLVPIRTAKKATKGLNAKIISVYHQSPDANGRIQAVDDKINFSRSWTKRQCLKLVRAGFQVITSKAMRYNYMHSDKFVLLSESYQEIFKEFTGIIYPAKLGIITNPISIDAKGCLSSLFYKQKEIIYVGRLDFIQKRVFRVIDSWNLLWKNNPEWKLTIIGEGPERQNLENQVKNLGIKNVSFEGFQNPIKYYKHATAIVLTSEFEGFPLVLAESMSFGVIPVVYDSFASVRDIIDDGVNGLIVPKDNGAFNAKLFSTTIQKILNNPVMLEAMAKSAIDKSHKYSLDSIYQQWVNLFEELS